MLNSHNQAASQYDVERLLAETVFTPKALHIKAQGRGTPRTLGCNAQCRVTPKALYNNPRGSEFNAFGVTDFNATSTQGARSTATQGFDGVTPSA